MIPFSIQTPEGPREFFINYQPSPATVASKFKADRLVKVRLYGRLARAAGQELFNLAICSTREAIHALHCITDGRTTRYIQRTLDTVKWRIVVNGEQLNGDSPTICDEMIMERTLERIDIYPVPQGAAGMGNMSLILGAVLLVVGIVLMFTPLAPIGAAIAMAGVAALLSGVMGLMNTPQKAPTQKAAKTTPSYLFSGSVNTQDQGGPVPVAYGNVMIGSQTLSAEIRSSETIYIGNPAWQTVRMAPLAILEPGTALSTWMERLSLSVFPTALEQMTSQAPQIPGGPLWAIKYIDGSFGFGFDPDPTMPLVRAETASLSLPQQTPQEANYNRWMSDNYLTVMPTIIDQITPQVPQVVGGPAVAQQKADTTIWISYDPAATTMDIDLGKPKTEKADATYKSWMRANNIVLLPTLVEYAQLQIPLHPSDPAYPTFALLNDDGSIELIYNSMDPAFKPTTPPIVWPVATPGAGPTIASSDLSALAEIQMNPNP